MSNIEPTPFGDKYVLVEHIATGGMAEIYRAQYAGIEGFAKELVVKTLRQEFAARPEVVGMFLDEARVAATLTHNNVVHTYDLGELGGEYFIAMELLKGEELVNVMRRAAAAGRGIPLELSIGIIMQSCEGLHYVHSRTTEDGTPLGLVHRDINPTNIHVGYDGVCKILDFGIAATRASAVAKKGQVAGKLSYMAPEQLLGHPIDQRADIFPLGVVLYELCLGRRLFRGAREEVTRRVLEGDIPAPTFVDPKFPPALEAIIMRALEVDPADRYQNCDHFFRDLEAFLTEAGLSWTPRRLSAVMSELFGEGAPANVDYDDEYSDLDQALDFAAFDAVPEAGDDDVPEWARTVEAGNPQPRKRPMTIGNIEALVSQARFDESAPHPVARDVPPPTASPPARPPKPTGASEDAREGADPTRSGVHRAVQAPEGDRSRRRPGTGSRPVVRPARNPTPGSGRHPVATTGPLAAIAPDAASGRTFGHSVVSDESKRGGSWVWILGLLAVSGLGYVAYALFTTK
ncbi:MAG: protein kinase [Deltaproteobacteria bacterium]|nr:protein kinase [Deltaproteobacteria bacterium]MBK8236539.1 protein kinase [Deltaproteobacteria bacterium]MBK8717836.1 protein kinase [Deltaproteobacteria bacterium]MBP7287802.1 protein kinase [Nannocystaceae bacterium]